jgi:hypothetical protein
MLFLPLLDGVPPLMIVLLLSFDACPMALLWPAVRQAARYEHEKARGRSCPAAAGRAAEAGAKVA